MNIMIAGGSGFIGQALVSRLSRDHDLTILSRKPIAHSPVPIITWDTLKSKHVEQYDAIINLCGANISKGRWSKARKLAILQSRTTTTSRLVDLISQCKRQPHLYNASAIGIYPNASTALSEDTALTQAEGFLSDVAIQWEAAVKKSSIKETRLRFGVVLGNTGGMLKQVIPFYKMGLAGRIGSGQQYMSWIHIDDLTKAVQFLLEHRTMTGPVNITAPNPCTQLHFAQTLAGLLHRPCLIPMPRFVLDMLYGEMGQSLLLANQQITQKALSQQRFTFQYPDISTALTQLVRHT